MEIYDSLMAIYDKIILCLIDNHLWPFPSAKRKFIYDHLWLHWLKFMIISSAKRKFIYEHLCLHWLKFMAISQREAQNHSRTFMSSLIEIYDHFQREAQIHLWAFMVSLMIIFDPKKARSAKRKTEEYLCLHLYHFWQRKTHSSQEFMSNFKSRTKRLPRIQVTVSHNQRLRIPSMQIPQ